MIHIMIIYRDAIMMPIGGMALTITELREHIAALQRFNADFTHLEAKEAKADLPKHGRPFQPSQTLGMVAPSFSE